MALYRVSIRGTHPAGDQIQYGFHVSDTDILGLGGDAGDLAELVSTQMESQVTTWGSGWPTGTRGTLVVVYEVDSTTGQSIDIGQADVNMGTGSGSPLPPQCALVVSLSAGVGRRRNGRMYLPAPVAGALGGTGLLNTSGQTSTVNAWQNIFQGINTGLLAGKRVVVYSGSDRAARTVTSIKVGNVLDVQRRRANAVTETYEARTVSLV